jgi:hypothetical protein
MLIWRSVLLTLSVPFLSSCGAAAAADPSPEDLVNAYEKACKAYERAAYRVEMKTLYTGPKQQPPGLVPVESDMQVWRDGDRCKFIHSRTSRFQAKGELIEQEHAEEQLFPGKGFIIVRIKPLQLRQPPVRARLGELTEREKGLLYRMPVALLHGRLDYNIRDNTLIPLPEILRESQLSTRKAELDGKPVWVLEATGKWGAHTLWLDSAAGLLPRRIEQRKKGADWTSPGMPMNSLPPYSETRFYPAAKATEVALIIDGVQIERFGATDLLTGFTIRDTIRFDNGQSVTWTGTTRVRDVKLNPGFATDDPFRITSPVPDGAAVHVFDAPNIAFEWRGGKIVRKPGLVGALGRHFGVRFLVRPLPQL